MSQIAAIKRWDIIPYAGVGPIRFGMTRAEVRLLLGDGLSVIKKWPYREETDAYKEIGLHLEYDAKDRLECIEVWGSCPIHYKGAALLNASIQEVLERLANLGLSPRYDDGYFLDDGGFALYAPDDVVTAVTVYKKGYYDEAPEGVSNN